MTDPIFAFAAGLVGLACIALAVLSYRAGLRKARRECLDILAALDKRMDDIGLPRAKRGGRS